MKILFIGNSYTFFNDMPKLLLALARENGKECEVFSVTKGGRKLYANLSEGDEWGEKIRALANEHSFDCLILQEQSFFPLIDKENFHLGVGGLIDLVHASRSILYVTWGRKAGCPLLDEHGWTSDMMGRELYLAYLEAAEKYGAELSEIGLCFMAIGNSLPEAELYASDLSHPSYLGSCVAAIGHYKRIFGEMPSTYHSLDCADISKEILNIVNNTIQ